MAKFYVATLAKCVIVEANNVLEAVDIAAADLDATMIRTVRPATRDEIDLHGSIACHFCNRRVANVEQAIDAGWLPSFFDIDGDEIAEPVCPDCCNEYGEYIQVTD